MKKNKKSTERIQRFIACNSKMRERTLDSERAFLKLANNISQAQLHILLSVDENTPCSMSRLAEILRFSKPNITQMMNGLIQKKLVKKIKREDDQRAVDIILLEKGKKIVALYQAHVERVAIEFLESMTDAEQEVMLRMWEKYLR